MRPLCLTGVTLACFYGLAAQQETPPQFDVASVNPSSPAPTAIAGLFRKTGGPGTSDPGRVLYHNYPLQLLILDAYEVKSMQLLGPAWLKSLSLMGTEDKYEVEARFPPETTKERFRLMLQNLLAGRFALKVHREKRPGPVYLLVVNKGGAKIQEAPALLPGTQAEPSPKLGPRGEDDFPVMPPGYSGLFVHTTAGSTRMKFMRRTMPEFAEWLWSQAQKYVLDRTEMKSRYDFYLEYRREVTARVAPDGSAPAGDSGGPDLLEALQSQLGLKLVSDKGESEVLVVDHVDRMPQGN